MAYLQFLSGSRDQDLAELNDQASLTLGSDAAAHVRCTDPGVDARHCQVYPAEGNFWLQNFSQSTVIDMARVAPQETRQLTDKAVFIVGKTYMKFWTNKPASGGGGGGGGGGDAAELSAAKAELAEAKAKIANLESSSSQGDVLQQQLDEQRRAAEAAQSELQGLEQKLSAAKAEAESLAKEKEELSGKVEQSEGELTKVKAQAEADVNDAKTQAEAEVSAAKEAAEAQIEAAKQEGEAELEAKRQELEAEREESVQALAASRAALTVLRDRDEALGRDPLEVLGAPGELVATIDSLDLPGEVRARLLDEVRAEIDREVLRRGSGPVVPVRGLRVPGSHVDLEGVLLAVKLQAKRVEVARELGLASLEADALEALLGKARS